MWSSILNNQQILSDLKPEEIPSIIVLITIKYLYVMFCFYCSIYVNVFNLCKLICYKQLSCVNYNAVHN